MSEANVSLVRAIYDAWSSGRSAAPFIDEAVEYVNPPYAVEPGVKVGRKMFAAIRSSYDDVRIEPQEYLDTPGDDVVVIARVTGRGHMSGLEVDWRQGYIWTIQGGRVVRFRWFNAPDEALAAAGLSPGDADDR
jgi:ketosteroid isomerase-like protein